MGIAKTALIIGTAGALMYGANKIDPNHHIGKLCDNARVGIASTLVWNTGEAAGIYIRELQSEPEPGKYALEIGAASVMGVDRLPPAGKMLVTTHTYDGMGLEGKVAMTGYGLGKLDDSSATVLFKGRYATMTPSGKEFADKVLGPQIATSYVATIKDYVRKEWEDVKSTVGKVGDWFDHTFDQVIGAK